MSHKQLARVIDQVLEGQEEKAEVDQSTVDDYKKLNDKCDVVISKIKDRKSKSKKTAQQAEG